MLILTISLFCLLATFCLGTTSSSFRQIRRHQPKAQALDISRLFFYFRVQQFLFRKGEFDLLFFYIGFAKYIFYFFYVAAAIMFCFLNYSAFFIAEVLLFVLLGVFFSSLLPHTISRNNPEKVVKILAPIVSIFLVMSLPLSYIFLRCVPLTTRQTVADREHITDKIIELFEETSALDSHHKKLIESTFTLKDRIAREIMKPRINVFSLDIFTPIREAALLMEEEGFSRVPVYEGNVDQIVGVLMYKDLLALYQKEDPSLLNQPIKTITKDVLYTPETKRVINLLQEFRTKQMHMAIVVDEYGGTEGIVTIEDILEEIVGEISDEHDDVEEETLFSVESTGGWIVDAHMNILDIEDELGVKIPQEGEYDTLGGYIFHRAGEIPKPGLIIYHDKFKLEILKSTERSIEKVKIIPL
jgi:putative hemolysin